MGASMGCISERNARDSNALVLSQRLFTTGEWQ